MTRINLTEPRELNNKHLLAEIRELPRVFSYVRKHGVAQHIPDSYILGQGHVKFFTNKLNWLLKRWEQLLFEWVAVRGYNYSLGVQDIIDKYEDLFIEDAKNYDYEYFPTQEEIQLNRLRIEERKNVR